MPRCCWPRSDREGRPRDAGDALRRAIGYLENSRAELSRDESKLTYSAVLIEPYREYVDLLFRQNCPGTH